MERFYLQMHITNKCSNRCRHCYQTKYNGEDMSVNSAEAVISELSNIGKNMMVNSEIAITGGDPLMHHDFLEILKIARKLCTNVYVMGNPEFLDKKMISDIKEIGIDWFQLSLDGTEKIHDKQRSKNSFQRTCKAITDLSNAGIKVAINMTLTSRNRHVKEETEIIAKALGANYFGCEECVAHGEDCNGKNNQQCSLGFSVMAILPDLTLMACRRTPSSILGKWSPIKSLESYFVNNHKMIMYRERHKKNVAFSAERRKKEQFHQHWQEEPSLLNENDFKLSFF